MRIRSVKPDYWKDGRLHNTPGISADVREFYIGCWGLADDAGFMRWDVPEIAGELYRFRGVQRRERNVTEWARRLVALGRLMLLTCDHAYLPTLTKHQRLGGSRSEGVWKEHQQCIPGHVQTSTDSSESSPTVGKGEVGEVKEGEFSEPDLTNITDPKLRQRLEAKVKKSA